MKNEKTAGNYYVRTIIMHNSHGKDQRQQGAVGSDAPAAHGCHGRGAL